VNDRDFVIAEKVANKYGGGIEKIKMTIK